MSEKIVQLNEEAIKGQIKKLVHGSVEETRNGLLEAEAQRSIQAADHTRSRHYQRNLTTTSGDVTLNVPRLKGATFETAIIVRYRRRESSVEGARIEMHLTGVSVRRVEDMMRWL